MQNPLFDTCEKVSILVFFIGIGVAGGRHPIIRSNYRAKKYGRGKKAFLLSARVLFQAI